MMLYEFKRQLLIIMRMFFCLTLITGGLYPLLIFGFGKLFFPWQAHGSLITRDGITMGSLLIGQSFTSKYFFAGRPSATMPVAYNALMSLGSNFGPSNADFLTVVKQRIHKLRQDPSYLNQTIPVEMVTASASGLDPEISPLAAYLQVPRIARARNISKKQLLLLIKQSITPRTFGILGENRVNVLTLNLLLEKSHLKNNATTKS